MPEYFPRTTERVPPLLIPLEVVRLLRLDVRTNGDGEQTQRAPADALRTLERLVGKGHLAPRQFGKSRTYAREDVLHLIRNGPPS